jgi:acyl dehydratase
MENIAMPLNKACVGKQYPPITTNVTAEAFQKYARACNDDNRAFFDAKRPTGIVAPPMFGVVVTWQSVLQAVFDSEVGVDPIRLVHGEQDMEFRNPMRPGDAITSTSKIASIETKATGETMVIELNAHNQRGEPVQKTFFTIFIRGTGGKVSSAEARHSEPQRKEPLVVVSQTIDKDQTYRYAEASGDRNPIHVDPNVAKMAGLPGIIVHGLCTMAFTSKVMIDKLCAGDPTRLKRLRVRFSRPVLPGQTITTKVWQSGERDGRSIYDYETYNPDGQAVIRGGIAEVAR